MAGRNEDDPEEPATDRDAGADPAAGREGDAGGPPDGDGDEEDWRFGVDDVGEDGLVQTAIEAEEPDPEHAVFVVLGALAMVLVFVHLWTLV